MKKKSLPKKVERWVIERVDGDVSMVRVEVTSRSKKIPVSRLVARMQSASSEDLGWWDRSTIRSESRPVDEVVASLGLSDATELQENMVFWVFGAGETIQFVHATRMARELSGELYRKVLDRQVV